MTDSCQSQPLHKLFNAAQNHAEDTGEAHDVGDLEQMLRVAWELMLPSQRLDFLASSEVDAVIEAGARDEFTADALIEDVESALAAQEAILINEGYSFVENESGFHWETNDSVGTDCLAHHDAVDAAWRQRQSTLLI